MDSRCLLHPTLTLYHETRSTTALDGPSATESLLVSTTNGTYRSGNMALFGCRNIRNAQGRGGPPFSPHGDRRAVVPVNTVIESDEDYLFPLNESVAEDGHLRQSLGWPNNWYVDFLYVKAKTVDRIRNRPGIDQAWLHSWKIVHHPYFRMANGNVLQYAHQINGRKTWCKILVPYQVQFTPAVRWEDVKDWHSWDHGVHEVTEQMTVSVAIHLGLLPGL